MTTGFIICGALGREVIDLIQKYGWDAQVIGIPAVDHVFPQRIAPDVEKRITELQEQYERLIVVFGDCGSRGALDEMLSRYPDIERIAGPHCYEMYGGELFEQLITEEPGTYILTDFMVRTFQGLILKSMGLHKYPQLKGEYFKNYKRVVYLAQSENPTLTQKAHEVAKYLELPLEIRYTGFGLLEERLIAMMQQN
ncbi:MAG: DUF1638 domain-containing protein [Anaerolineae bacterium]|nr:DUF1638 domain-containing protein [Anaerolineae bacterium]MBL6965902.1 DUF1638 domain-containing protein [Anaerolineales bacterium]